MNKAAVLIAEPVNEVLTQGLTAMDLLCEQKYNLTPTQLLEIIPRYEGIIVRSNITIDVPLINAASKLRFIGRTGSGMEKIAVAYAEQKGIKCFSSPEGNKDAVAEHVMGFMLSMLKNISSSNLDMRQLQWTRQNNTGNELYNKTVGIVGFGNVGQALAERLVPFGCKILAYDKYRKNFSTEKWQECDLRHIFEQADIVSLHVPLTAETQQWIDTKWFDSFRKPIYFINTCRGEVVNTSALIDELKNGKVKAAALDVFENENFATLTPTQKHNVAILASMPNVILTPHIAGVTHESNYKLSAVLLKKIQEFYLMSN
ncbi:MAG: NAD(P)-dependent oxidoreductase [Chitinophagales bacterium]|nr:hypothetical protein [Bacteroidota bacterium]MCB9043219.1 hypothetical protein [Chitinophagales bacterium]